MPITIDGIIDTGDHDLFRLHARDPSTIGSVSFARGASAGPGAGAGAVGEAATHLDRRSDKDRARYPVAELIKVDGVISVGAEDHLAHVGSVAHATGGAYDAFGANGRAGANGGYGGGPPVASLRLPSSRSIADGSSFGRSSSRLTSARDGAGAGAGAGAGIGLRLPAPQIILGMRRRIDEYRATEAREQEARQAEADATAAAAAAEAETGLRGVELAELAASASSRRLNRRSSVSGYVPPSVLASIMASPAPSAAESAAADAAASATAASKAAEAVAPPAALSSAVPTAAPEAKTAAADAKDDAKAEVKDADVAFDVSTADAKVPKAATAAAANSDAPSKDDAAVGDVSANVFLGSIEYEEAEQPYVGVVTFLYQQHSEEMLYAYNNPFSVVMRLLCGVWWNGDTGPDV